MIIRLGNEGVLDGIDTMTDAEKFEHLRTKAGDLGISMKVGGGQFRDRVELNALLRDPHTVAYRLLPRRGYRIAEFVVQRQPHHPR
jgi:hypothetical protein